MSSKFSRVARMGSNNSKYGEQRSEIEKGDAVIVRGLNNEITDRGVAVRVSRSDVVVKGENGQRAYIISFVELA